MLNLAWDAVVKLYFNIENSKIKEWYDNGEVTEKFWQSGVVRASVSSRAK